MGGEPALLSPVLDSMYTLIVPLTFFTATQFLKGKGKTKRETKGNFYCTSVPRLYSK